MKKKQIKNSGHVTYFTV